MPSFEQTLPYVPYGSRVLSVQQPFVHGTDVKVLQRIVATMGSLLTTGRAPAFGRFPIDGVFGPATAQAVRQVQRHFGLAATGSADRSLYRLSGQETDAYGGPTFGSRALGPGARGGDVTALQNRLACYRYGLIVGQPANAIYGPSTADAVKAFQADQTVFQNWFVSTDGVVSSRTFDQLWIHTFAGGRTLTPGDDGFDSAFVQIVLANAGFYEGAIDGLFGPRTEQAVRAYQRTVGLLADGVVGVRTFFALGLANRTFWTSLRSRPFGTIADLEPVRAIASVIDPVNGDRNPYGLVIAPDTFDAAATVLQPDDLLVSNLNNAANVMGQGTTVERVHMGQAGRFFGEAQAPIALATSNLGATWIADFGLAPSGSQGVVQVITPDGALFSGGTITSPLFAGPWGMRFNWGPLYGLPPTFFSTNVLTGTVDQMSRFVPPNFGATTVVVQIGSTLGHRGNTIDNVVGPQGMVWLPIGDTLYVADGANNRIAAYPHASTLAVDQEQGVTVYEGPPLNQPAGLALNPLNGNLLAVNQMDNALVEISRDGHAVARRILDPTPVNPATGAGSALFGVATRADDEGNLLVIFTNDNSNTVNELGA